MQPLANSSFLHHIRQHEFILLTLRKLSERREKTQKGAEIKVISNVKGRRRPSSIGQLLKFIFGERHFRNIFPRATDYSLIKITQSQKKIPSSVLSRLSNSASPTRLTTDVSYGSIFFVLLPSTFIVC